MLCGYFVLCVFRLICLICTIRKKEKHKLIICQNVQKAKEAIFNLIGNCTNYWQPNISTQCLKCQINKKLFKIKNFKLKLKFRTRWAALMFLQTKYLNFSLSWKRGAAIADCRAKETNWNSPVKFAPHLFSRGNVSLFRLRPPVRRRPLTAAISHVALLIPIAAFKRRACVSSCPWPKKTGGPSLVRIIICRLATVARISS